MCLCIVYVSVLCEKGSPQGRQAMLPTTGVTVAFKRLNQMVHWEHLQSMEETSEGLCIGIQLCRAVFVSFSHMHSYLFFYLMFFVYVVH